MIHLVVLLVLGIMLLLCFLIIALKVRTSEPSETLPVGDLRRIINLPGLSFAGADLLFDDRDYELLRCQPALHEVARQLRQQRRAMVLLWLNDLQGDVRTLWRFRRFLVCSGVETGFLEEIDIVLTATLAQGLLLGLKVLTFMAGPFALKSILRKARNQVEVASRICAGLLAKLPSAGRLEVERRWGKEIG